MDLKDATLVFLVESASYPTVAELAQAAYDRILDGQDIGYPVLDELIGEASGKGLLRAMHRKYDPVAYEAILAPILHEIDRKKPIRSSRPGWHPADGVDPLGAPSAR
jgi:hypothetical protein